MPVKNQSKQEILKQAKAITIKLLKLLSIKNPKLKINLDKNNILNINIDCENLGVLIGYKGDTISSLQLILALMLYKKLGSWQKVVVNVGDYREQRQKSLEKLALNTAQKVKFSGEQSVLPKLNPAERRIIHLTLADNTDVVTESRGEGTDRKLIIKPKGVKKIDG